MNFTTTGIIILLLAILPGVLTRAYTRRYVLPQIRPPTALEETAAAALNSVLVHILGLALALLAIYLWEHWRGSLDLTVLETTGFSGYFKVHPLRLLAAGSAYSLYVIVASVLFGIFNVPNRLYQYSLLATSRMPGAGGAVPQRIFTDDPIWYHAFHTRKPSSDATIYVRVRMKNKDVYQGTLVAYPILGDDAKSKDFLINDVLYLPGGDPEKVVTLDAANVPGFGGVLLNSADADAIELAYGSAPLPVPPNA